MKNKDNTKEERLSLFFGDRLLAWHREKEQRPLPWKNSQNPYHIWLSEVILQQTRVEQGLPYYQKFIAAYPTINDMALAKEDELLKLWQGLGYYARARNMHATARYIYEHCGGKFPDSYTEIRALKGVGDYTAAAVASFAFGLPYAVLDGNVFRLLSRFFGIETPIDSSLGKKKFGSLAQQLLPMQAAAEYNQAIMDFGALVCKPKGALCTQCPLSGECYAFKNEAQQRLPQKSKSIVKQQRYFYYWVWRNAAGQTLLHKREEGDIWKGLYDFPLTELAQYLDPNKEGTGEKLEQLQEEKSGIGAGDITFVGISKLFRQTLTHRYITAHFIELQGEPPAALLDKDQYILCPIDEVYRFAFPKLVQDYLDSRGLSR